MPRGRKKAQTENKELNQINTSVEAAAEIAPADVKTVNEKAAPKADTKKGKEKSDKTTNKRGRKPKSADKTSAAAETQKKAVKATAPTESSIEKTKSNAGRKPKAASKPASKTTSAKAETKSTAKNGRKPRTEKNAAAAPAVTDIAAPVEKKKRTYNKKAKSDKAENIVIQSSGNDYSMSDITEMCKNDYRGGTRKQIKSIKVYIKSENNNIRAYYVINDKASGYIDL